MLLFTLLSLVRLLDNYMILRNKDKDTISFLFLINMFDFWGIDGVDKQMKCGLKIEIRWIYKPDADTTQSFYRKAILKDMDYNKQNTESIDNIDQYAGFELEIPAGHNIVSLALNDQVTKVKIVDDDNNLIQKPQKICFMKSRQKVFELKSKNYDFVFNYINKELACYFGGDFKEILSELEAEANVLKKTVSKSLKKHHLTEKRYTNIIERIRAFENKLFQFNNFLLETGSLQLWSLNVIIKRHPDGTYSATAIEIDIVNNRMSNIILLSMAIILVACLICYYIIRVIEREHDKSD